MCETATDYREESDGSGCRVGEVEKLPLSTDNGKKKGSNKKIGYFYDFWAVTLMLLLKFFLLLSTSLSSKKGHTHHPQQVNRTKY